MEPADWLRGINIKGHGCDFCLFWTLFSSSKFPQTSIDSSWNWTEIIFKAKILLIGKVRTCLDVNFSPARAVFFRAFADYSIRLFWRNSLLTLEIFAEILGPVFTTLFLSFGNFRILSYYGKCAHWVNVSDHKIV